MHGFRNVRRKMEVLIPHDIQELVRDLEVVSKELRFGNTAFTSIPLPETSVPSLL